MLGVLALAFVPMFGLLAHEMGHAFAALVLTRGRVEVIAGRTPGLLRVRLGRLQVQIHLEPPDDSAADGRCRYEAPPWPHQDAWIVAAGPIGSLLWGAACAVALGLWAGELSLLCKIGLALGAVEGAIDAVVNSSSAVLPRFAERHPRSDGARFRHELAKHRALKRFESSIGRRLTRAEMRQLNATGKVPSWLRYDTRGSVPPPSSRLP